MKLDTEFGKEDLGLQISNTGPVQKDRCGLLMIIGSLKSRKFVAERITDSKKWEKGRYTTCTDYTLSSCRYLWNILSLSREAGKRTSSMERKGICFAYPIFSYE